MISLWLSFYLVHVYDLIVIGGSPGWYGFPYMLTSMVCVLIETLAEMSLVLWLVSKLEKFFE